MRPSGRSLSELQKAAQPTLLRPGWYDAEFGEVIERLSQRRNEIFDAQIIVREANGTMHEIRDFLTDTGRGGLKFYNACVAVGLQERFNAKQEIYAFDFSGRPARVKVGVEKGRGGFLDRNRIEDYAPPAAENVTPLRSAS